MTGPNELVGARRVSLVAEAARQLTHPLALLLWVAAALAWPTSGATLAIVIVGVILLNAAFAIAQERQAVRAVEALRAYIPARAVVIRDGCRQEVEARLLVPGDVMVVEEGDRISADARLLSGACSWTCRRSPGSRCRSSGRPWRCPRRPHPSRRRI